MRWWFSIHLMVFFFSLLSTVHFVLSNVNIGSHKANCSLVQHCNEATCNQEKVCNLEIGSNSSLDLLLWASKSDQIFYRESAPTSLIVTVTKLFHSCTDSCSIFIFRVYWFFILISSTLIIGLLICTLSFLTVGYDFRTYMRF